MESGVKGQVAVITGSAQGIGRHIAQSFGTAGANVVLADVAPLENTIAEVTATGAQWHAVATDVTREDEVEALMRAAWQRFGRIDILINCAAIVTHFHTGAPRWPRIRDMGRPQFQRVIDTNLVGTFLCTKHVLPYMESLNSGHIVNFGQGSLSEEPTYTNIGSCAYEVTKIAIQAFTRGVAAEEREYNICVVSMGPSIGPRASRPRGPGVPGGGGGIITADSPDWARHQDRELNLVENIKDAYVLAAQAPMELSGKQVTVRDGVVVPSER